MRQVIDSTTVFTELCRVKAQARPYAGSMYWKKEGVYEYLVKTRPRRRSQERLGRRSEPTERIFAEFTSRKQALESRLASLREALTEAERMNKALKAGRTPNLAVEVLQVLDGAGLAEHFTVVGTHALYAYETAASVRIAQGALATLDVDLSWDARKRVQFMTDLERLDASVLSVLKRADPTSKPRALMAVSLCPCLRSKVGSARLRMPSIEASRRSRSVMNCTRLRASHRRSTSWVARAPWAMRTLAAVS